MIGLFCKRAIRKRRYSAKETYSFIDPTDRSHPIQYVVAQMCVYVCVFVCVGVHVCVCACVRERERVCVCVCV